MIHAKVIVMKISNSKKELARIISEHGGWRNGEFAAQDGDGGVGGYDVKPEWSLLGKYWRNEAWGEWFLVNKIKNHHQTVLSRAEYFHLYPAAEPAQEPASEVKPIIEQLAADYRNTKDYAERKQQEADAAKADADAKLADLVAAGKALGLALSVADPEPGLVITDWRDLRVGDEVEIVESFSEERVGHIGVITRFSETDEKFRVRVHFNGNEQDYEWISKWRFIRRP